VKIDLDDPLYLLDETDLAKLRASVKASAIVRTFEDRQKLEAQRRSTKRASIDEGSNKSTRERRRLDTTIKLLKPGQPALAKLRLLEVGDYFVVTAFFATSVRSMINRESYANLKKFKTSKFRWAQHDYIKVKRLPDTLYSANLDLPKPITATHAQASPTATQASPTATQASAFTPQAPIEQTVADVAELEDFDVWFSKKPKIRRAFTTGERDPNKYYTPEGWEMTADERQAQIARHRIPDDEWADPVEEY